MHILLSTLTLGLAGQTLGRAIMDIKTRSLTDDVGHGNYANFDGRVQRWHEVSEDLFVAVDPDKWDDSSEFSPNALDKQFEYLHLPVHVRRSLSPEKRAIANEVPGVSPVPRTEGLEQRDFEQVCTVLLDCAEAVGTQLTEKGSNLLNLGERFISKIVVDLGPQFIEVMKDPEVYKPTIASFIGIGAQGFLVQLSMRLLEPAMPDATPKETESIAICDPSMSHEDIAKMLNLKACQGYPERNSYEYKVVMPDGSGWSWSVSAGPGKSLAQTDVCAAAREDEMSWIE